MASIDVNLKDLDLSQDELFELMENFTRKHKIELDALAKEIKYCLSQGEREMFMYHMFSDAYLHEQVNMLYEMFSLDDKDIIAILEKCNPEFRSWLKQAIDSIDIKDILE